MMFTLFSGRRSRERLLNKVSGGISGLTNGGLVFGILALTIAFSLGMSEVWAVTLT